MKFEEALSKIKKLDDEALNHARQRWDSVAKPLRSLGMLEEAIIKKIEENTKRVTGQ